MILYLFIVWLTRLAISALLSTLSLLYYHFYHLEHYYRTSLSTLLAPLLTFFIHHYTIVWRKQLREKGLEKILSHMLQTAVIGGVAKEKDFKQVIADTTVWSQTLNIQLILLF